MGGFPGKYVRAELDRTILSLDKAKRLVELKKQRDYIIKRLNADFQKTWFGQYCSGDVWISKI